jgi:nucleoredoxin
MSATDTKKTPMEELLGENLLTKVKGPKKATSAALKDKDLVLLYFSASWCPPCRQFSPILKDFYKSCAEKGKIEIVYVSSDKNIQEFEEYFGSMPWLSLPEGAGESSSTVKNQLAQSLQISGIPTLVVVDTKTGKFVTGSAREDITRVGGNNPDKGLELIQQWKTIEPVPFSEASLSQGPGGILGIIQALVMYILRNPIFIFGK